MDPLPGALRPLTGTTVTSWQSLPPGIGWPLDSEIPDLTGPATYWVETLHAETAVSLVRYTDGTAALTENVVGNGRVYHLGWYPTPDQAIALLRYLAPRHGLTPLADLLPPGLFASQRGDYLILLNYTDQPLTAVVNGSDVVVNGRDVRVLHDRHQ